MRTDVLKRNIIQMFNENEIHGYDIAKKLAEKSEEIELSRLYRVLNDMAKEGLLIGRWEKSNRGPRKKLYSLDKKGNEEKERILLEAIEIVHDHYDKYIMGLPPEFSVFEILVDKITKGVTGSPNIVYITPFFASIHQRMIITILEHLPESNIYLIMPRHEEVPISSPRLVQMEGFYTDIPLKQNFSDIVFITGVPPVNMLDKAIVEWKRSLKEGGKVAIVTPKILLEETHHPMPIGKFIENREHTATKKFDFPGLEEFETKLTSEFDSFTKYNIIHLTTYIVR
jgi:DNA-binding PadR family transcriptional regulator